MIPLLCTALLALPAPTADELSWFQGPYSSALGKARAENTRAFLYFWADGSAHCANLWSETLTKPAAAAELAGLVCYGVDAASARGGRLVQQYGVTTLPAMLVVEGDGSVEDGIFGYLPEAAFLAEVRRIAAGVATVGYFRQRAAEAPDDLMRRLELAVKLRDVGATAEADTLTEEIRRADPEGRSIAGARLLLWEIQDAIDAGSPTDPAAVDLSPLYEHMPKVRPEVVRFEGWAWAAGRELERERRVEARRAYAEAWAVVPEAQVLNWGNQTANLLWSMGEELNAAEEALALDMATRASARAELLARPEGDGFGNRFTGDDFDAFLAGRLDTLARCQALAGRLREAIATAERCLALDPENEEYGRRLEGLRAARGDR